MGISLVKNMNAADRGLRFLIGILMISWAIAGGPAAGWIGLFPLGTSAWGFCPFYWLVKIKNR